MDAHFLETIEIPVGRLVWVELRGKEIDSLKSNMKGIVTACDKRHFTIQVENYGVSFLKVDLVLGLIRLPELKTEVYAAKEETIRTSKGSRGSLRKKMELILDAVE